MGVILGVLGLVALAVVALFILRRRRRKNVSTAANDNNASGARGYQYPAQGQLQMSEMLEQGAVYEKQAGQVVPEKPRRGRTIHQTDGTPVPTHEVGELEALLPR